MQTSRKLCLKFLYGTSRYCTTKRRVPDKAIVYFIIVTHFALAQVLQLGISRAANAEARDHPGRTPVRGSGRVVRTTSTLSLQETPSRTHGLGTRADR